MSWYYADSGRQAGPVDDANFDALIQQGAIRPETLVWREGMANWQPLSTVRPPAPPPLGPGTMMPNYGQAPLAGAVAAAAAPVGSVVCANCGGRFAQSDVVFIGSSYVCGSCKPLYLQRMREGSAAGAMTARRYGGFWIRFVAAVVDGLIQAVVFYAIAIPLGIFTFSDSADPFANIGLIGLLNLGSLAMNACYAGYFVSTKGATPGKMLVGLRVIRSDNSGLTFGRAAGRELGKLVSSAILFIGYIIAGFDPEKRALHDHLADTRVIFK